MNYPTGRAFRQALESRLRKQSLQTAIPRAGCASWWFSIGF